VTNEKKDKQANSGMGAVEGTWNHRETKNARKKKRVKK